MGQVKLYRWSKLHGDGMWELFRTYKKVHDDVIDREIRRALEEGPSMECYRWECFNSEGLFEGNIYNNFYHTFIYVL